MERVQVKTIAKQHVTCRCCGSNRLTKYLDLGLMPLANNLEETQEKAINQERYPLEVMLCEDCGLSQLSVVVDPEVLFSYYTYRSSINQGYIEHCRQMSFDLGDKYNLNSFSFHIDIAGNDGTLLREFRKTAYHNVLNIDPAKNLIEISQSNGINSACCFWDIEAVNNLDLFGSANLITATNVFAHLDDVEEFLQACELALIGDGILVIENPYLIDFIENNEFDTVYFEHVSYWSVWPMYQLAESVGLKLIDCVWKPIHGGTMRYILARKDSKYNQEISVFKTFSNEINKGFKEIETYQNWSAKINQQNETFKQSIIDLKASGAKIAGFAASAKGNTLLNFAGLDYQTIDFIADETPEKIGKFSPGTGIPILGLEAVIDQQPDYIIILSWNFKNEIIAKLRPLFKGKFIIPIPELEII